MAPWSEEGQYCEEETDQWPWDCPFQEELVVPGCTGEFTEDEMSDDSCSEGYAEENGDAGCYGCVWARDFRFGVADNLDE